MKISEILQEMGKYAEGRLTRPEVEQIYHFLSPILNPFCKEHALVGSYRRGKTDIGDMDIIVADCDLLALDNHLTSIQGLLTYVRTGRGGKAVLTEVFEYKGKEIQVEFLNVPEKSFGAALMHSTGGKDFNVALRTYAKQKGYMLNQYGLISQETGENVASRTEENIFNALGMHFIPPLERNVSFWKLKDRYKA